MQTPVGAVNPPTTPDDGEAPDKNGDERPDEQKSNERGGDTSVSDSGTPSGKSRHWASVIPVADENRIDLSVMPVDSEGNVGATSEVVCEAVKLAGPVHAEAGKECDFGCDDSVVEVSDL